MHCLPRYLPFQDWDEWITVKDGLYSLNPSQRGVAVQTVEVWRSRGKVPHSVDSTAQMVEIGLSSSGWRSDMESRLLYTTAITRAINGLADNKQQGEHAEAVSKIVSSMGIPGWLVGVRHDGTHNELPTLPVLRVAASTMLTWFQDNYWTPQYDLLLQLSNICIPPSLQQSKASVLTPNASLDNPVLNFDSCLEKSSTTFVSDSFVPVFVAGCIKIPLKNSEQATLGNQTNLARKTVEKQKKHWLHYLTKVLNARSSNMHILLCRLLCTLVEIGSVSVSMSINEGEAGSELFDTTHWHLELALLWIAEVIQLIQQVHGIPTSGKLSSTLVRSASTASLNGVNIASSRINSSELAAQMAQYFPLVDTVLNNLQTVSKSRFSGSFLGQCSNKWILDTIASIRESVRSLYMNSMSEMDRLLVCQGIKHTVVSEDSSGNEQRADVAGDGGDRAGSSGALNAFEQFVSGLGSKGGPSKKKQKVTTSEATATNVNTIGAPNKSVCFSSLTSVTAVKSSCADGVRVCEDYPVWSLGLLPGQTSCSALLELELMDSR